MRNHDRMLLLKILTIFLIVSGTSLTAYTPVITPNGSTLPWKMEDGVKVFHLIAEPIKREFTPGFIVNCWGYNGQTPGPTIEVVEGDHVRILVTNHLSAPTSIHWHGILLPNGMDGVAGINQPPIPPGETFRYEFILKQSGTCMYHSHFDELVQIGMGLVGFFIIHPKTPESVPVDKDFAIMLGEWFIPIGGATPNPTIMLDFNYFTFNGKVYPGTDPLVVKLNEKVRIRLGNLSMDSHPIHLHGYTFTLTGNGAGPLPESARYQDVTIDVPTGSTRDIEFVANAPGDWLFHCHKTHHMMNSMSHELPNMLGVNQNGVIDKIRTLLPDYIPMGENGMEHLHSTTRPPNTPPTMVPVHYGHSMLGGMVTLLKVRKEIENADPAWYQPPAGTLAEPIFVDQRKDQSPHQH